MRRSDHQDPTIVLTFLDGLALPDKLYIYGVGPHGSLLSTYLLAHQRADVLGFVDRRASEIGRHRGRPVLNPAALLDEPRAPVLIWHPLYEEEMVKTLIQVGLPQESLLRISTHPNFPGPKSDSKNPNVHSFNRAQILLAVLSLGLLANLILFAVTHRSDWLLLGLVSLPIMGEILVRCLRIQREVGTGAILNQVIAPFLETTATPSTAPHTTLWEDQVRGRNLRAIHQRNLQGFNLEEDLALQSLALQRSPREKLVLITGGSTVHGVGASCREQSIQGRLEHHLNTNQDRFRYRVINLGQSNWIAFQEYIALSLWGKWMDPDWILVLDGHNDIAVTCAHAQGSATPMFFYHIASYIKGYLENQDRPSFYRGRLENLILRSSRLYSWITGKRYVPCPQHLVYDEGFPRVGTPVGFDDIEKQITFYCRSQELIVGLSERAKLILALQPLIQPHSTIFGHTDGDLQRMAALHQNLPMGYQNFYSTALPYFMKRVEAEIQNLMEGLKDQRRIQFHNFNAYFPENGFERTWLFIDNMHLNDGGCNLVAELFSSLLLQEDLPERKEEFETRFRETLESMGALGPQPKRSSFAHRYKEMIQSDAVQDAPSRNRGLGRQHFARWILRIAFFGILTPTARFLRFFRWDPLGRRQWKKGRESVFHSPSMKAPPHDFNVP